ncbi:MAG: AsnC family transcriptional regulator [Candidatus Micrarchaeia archaeon]
MQRDKLPKAVKERIAVLESELNKKLSILRVYRGNYYVYSYERAISKATSKRGPIVRYVGKIDEAGIFKEPKYKGIASFPEQAGMNPKVRAAIDRLRAQNMEISLIPAKDAFYVYDIRFPEKPQCIGTIDSSGHLHGIIEREEPKASRKDKLDRADLAILRCLSMNARMPISNIAKIAGITPQAAFRRKAALEKKYGIKYFAEINLYKLGYSMFMCFVKFDDVVPDSETLRSALSKEPRVQLAMLAKGSYDLIFYMIAKSSNDAVVSIYKLRKGTLKDYKSTWYVGMYNNYYGYVPLRDEFFDIIEETKVWRRSRDEPTKPKDMMTQTEYLVLRDINTNGLSEFSDIAKRFNLKPQNVRYAYYALKEKYRFFTRITISIVNSYVKYDAIFLVKITNMSMFQDTRKELMLNVIEEKYPINKYILEGDISAPDGVMILAPIYSENNLDTIKKDLLNNIKGIEVEDLVVEEILIGRLCYRLFDNMYSLQYKPLVEKYKIKTYAGRILYDKEQIEEPNTTEEIDLSTSNSNVTG